MQLIEAIMQLDPDNDEHWTVDGHAKIPAVAAILGAQVSRPEIDEAAPGLSRSTHREALEGVAATESKGKPKGKTKAAPASNSPPAPFPSIPAAEPAPRAEAPIPPGPPPIAVKTWLYHPDALEGRIFEGDQIDWGLANGWKRRRQDCVSE